MLFSEAFEGEVMKWQQNLIFTIIPVIAIRAVCIVKFSFDFGFIVLTIFLV